MADSTQNDTATLNIFYFNLALILLIAGLAIHSFVIAVNVSDWLKGRLMTPVDHIVTALGISRMSIQCVITMCMFVVGLLLNHVVSILTLHIMGAIYSFFTYVNIWLTSLLSIVFCLKISNLRTRLFLYLRRMIDQRTAHCIVASVLLSTINSSMSVYQAITEVAKGGTHNTTMGNLLADCNLLTFLYSYTITAFIPLIFCCISSILLFSTLYHHTRNIKMSGNLSINLETYYSAMKFVSITFIYNMIYYTSHIVDSFYYLFYCEDLPWLHIVSGFLPALHSSYLIYRTAKLRSQMSEVLLNVIGFLLHKETGEEI